MATVVVVGASTGGLPMSYDIRKHLDKGHTVKVVSAVEDFTFVPSNPWVAVGWRKPEDISFKLEPRLTRKGIEFYHNTVTAMDPDNNQITLNDGSVMDYDYLVLATGPALAFDEVPGLGPKHSGGHTVSVCTTPHAVEAFEQWEEFCANPGPIVVGAVQGASCFGPAYEFAMIMETELRKRKIRNKVPMTFVTAEPYIGHLGLGGVGDSKGLMESEMRQRHINWICNAKVSKIEQGMMFVDEYNAQGEVIKQHELPFSYSMMLPAFKGTKFLQEMVDADPEKMGGPLVNPRGFVKVDQFSRNPTYHNIYALGVGIAIPPVDSTCPVPCGTPKTGLMIESMVTAICHNIEANIAGKEPHEEPTWNTVCLADMGDNGAAFVALPQIPPRNLTWAKKGKWVHLAKIAFEKYFIRNMKSGNSEPVYQKYIMKMLGINRLKSED
ncbi:NAD(P)/FAD-dependent oxidoreductase [Thiomicrorhabdus sediminis]|uniref:Sulfide-quinone reductase n=1 Tax=Thiomicrorhabdus sediminis TaxID=2580412 RepID=A0A4P9K5H2_9GAMM|nr:FAD-dependent oxidoreductase [Thiomicrorhabdus sediminis]QCU90219.1 NAD(P)/FAD-dependent oxidoreductase [Thiomicrorhabdus sediminis]